MTGHRHFNTNSSDHSLREGVNHGHRRRSDLHPLRRFRFRAQNLVEFALIFPVLMLLLFGIIDFGRIFHVLIAISNAAREGARYGVIYGIDRSGGVYTINESVIDAAAIQEAGNFNLQLTADQVTPSCPSSCGAGLPLRVVVTDTVKPIMTIVFNTDLTFLRDMEMMIP
ncbi:TadE/TadG family type IV pilus assembly protein [Chloroflexota bacterium]